MIEFLKNLDWSAIAIAFTIGGFVYNIIRNFRKDLKQDRERFQAALNAQDTRMLTALNSQDERIFQLATGKSLKDAMIEAKRKAEGL